jgi:CO/xanthine dehydrogenase Mo-binding subunit
VSEPSIIGAARPHVEGPRKVTGAERYAADYTPPGTLWGKTLRSPLPHARIVRLDTRAAAALPGVHAVVKGADLPPDTRVGRQMRDLPVLATERVRFVGDQVAAVAAVDPDVAEEALTRIEVEYEALPAVFDPLAAIEADAPLVQDPALVRAWAMPHQTVPNLPNTCAYETWRRGDVAAGLAAADVVLEETYRWPAQHQVYLEPHACLVQVAADGRVHVWASNKAPYLLRDYLAACLKLPEERFVVRSLPVGGDFGGKGSAMDVPLAYFLAQRTGRPVKMVMTYTEELLAGNPRHGAIVTVKLGATRDGRLTACQTRILYNSGAYAAFKPTDNLMLRGAEKGAGSYALPHVQIDAYMVYTNTVPAGHMRAPGMLQSVFAIESLVDAMCRRLEMDPFAFRRLNVVGEGGVSPAGERYREVRARETLDAAEAASGWRTPKPGPYVGRGLALTNKHPRGGGQHARLVVGGDGSVTLVVATPETGTGLHTVLRQIVAAELGLRESAVTVQLADTSDFPYDAGVGGSRLTQMLGAACQRCARAARDAVLPAAVAAVPGGSAPPISPAEGDWAVAAARAVAAHGAPLVFDADYLAVPFDGLTAFHAHVAEVAVDPETGQVTVQRLTAAADVGRVLNPLTHQGQIDGNLMQALSATTMEELDIAAGAPTTLHLGDYKVATMADVPPLVTALVESAAGPGPYHAKSVGEGPNAPTAAAIANAVYDACGVRITDLPITADKVWRGLQARRHAR